MKGPDPLRKWAIPAGLAASCLQPPIRTAPAHCPRQKTRVVYWIFLFSPSTHSVLTASVAALMDSLHLSMLISESPNNIIHQTRCRRNGHQQGLMRAGDDGRWRVSQAAQCLSRKKVMGLVDEIRFMQVPSNQPKMQVKKTVICVDIAQAISYLGSSLA